ncbi:conserved hypothetical protein [Desulfosarcina cetonica]|uniref:restriction endonuclease subunit S n=1 Tax=Desulfosarcina cetonica TaxID=90730 RepID=UPI0006CFEB89|nr:restriction endonuclease subunit S [Desulfosarcina cetonica]VTR70597.1 conserved hypothetical protein [Desulfosarcina cetonica]
MSWPKAQIGQFTHVVTKGTTPTKKQGFADFGINYIKAEALNGDSALDLTGGFFISEDVHQALKRSILEEGDVLLTIAGANIGKCGIVEERHLPANTNQAVGIMRVDRQQISPRFLYFWFKQPQTFRYIQGLNAQAAQPNINLTMLKNIEVPVPSISVQQRTVDILSAYDDLIENNRRRIQLLEQAARLLYKEWFVHLRFPGHEHVKVKDGVPEGWFTCPIKEAIVGLYDGPHATPAPADSGPVFLGIKNITDSGRLDLTNIRSIAENDYSRWIKRVTPQAGDIVFSYEATLNRYALIPKGFRGCLGRRLALIRPKQTERNSYFLFLTFFEDRWRATIEKNILCGATVDRIPLAKFPEFPILVPTKQLLAAFDDYVSPLYTQMELIDKMNIQLAQARDLLLPKLMNGIVTV